MEKTRASVQCYLRSLKKLRLLVLLNCTRNNAKECNSIQITILPFRHHYLEIALPLANHNLFLLVDGGHRAVIFDRFQGVKDTVTDEGTHFLIPWVQKPIIFDIRSRPRNVPVTTGSKGSMSFQPFDHVCYIQVGCNQQMTFNPLWDKDTLRNCTLGNTRQTGDPCSLMN